MTVNFKNTTAAVVMIAASALASGAAATTVNVAGFFDGSFSNVQDANTDIADGNPFDNRVINANGPGGLTWGTTASGPNATGPGSTLQVTPGNFTADFPPNGEIKFGTFTYFNASSFNTGGKWSVDMTLNIDFATPTNLGVLSEVITIQVENTTDVNEITGINESTGLIPDIISGVGLPAGAFSTPLDLGNDLKLTSVFMRPDDCSDAVTAEGVTTCSFDEASGIWTLREGAESTIGIYGTIEYVAPVPLPAAGWMLIAGIGGLVVLRRRKKA